MIILTVNTGSSSVRLDAFSADSGQMERIASSHYQTAGTVSHEILKSFIQRNGLNEISLAAHRVVHGGRRFSAPCLITPEVEAEIDRLSALAPLHNPRALTWISLCRELLGSELPQAAVFDTSFYAKMPDVAKIYALPEELRARHAIQRYGFHGIAHSAMATRILELRPDFQHKNRIITLQLGAGCSITAVKNGTAVDTSMGFSPLEGLVMATRSGDLDPGLVTHLIETCQYNASELAKILNYSSGLSGVSGISGDMKTLLESDAPEAGLAVELYCYRAKKFTGAYMAALGGADCIVFGGGVGENAPVIRRKILEGMSWCGIVIDETANDNTLGREGSINSPESNVDVMVLPVDEAAVLSEEALEVLKTI